MSDIPTFQAKPNKPAREIPRAAVVSWVLYDLANTIFSMNILSLYFSLHVRANVESGRADATYSFTAAISYAIVFLLSPILGAMTDRAPKRLPFLLVATACCITFTVFIGLTAWAGGTPKADTAVEAIATAPAGPIPDAALPPAGGDAPLARSAPATVPATAEASTTTQGGAWSAWFFLSLVCFVLANIAYQAALPFYDALLPEVCTEENRGRVGGIGVGVGFVGSYLGVGAGMVLLGLGFGYHAVFFATAIIFAAFAWPVFVYLRERGNPAAHPVNWRTAIEAVHQIKSTLTHARRYPGLLNFLIGRVFYTDGVNTVVAIMGLYVIGIAVRSGLDEKAGENATQIIMLIGITFAIIGGILWGFVTDRIGPKRTLYIVLSLWSTVFLVVFFAGWFNWPLFAMYPIGCFVGLAMGGTQAADRILMLRLTPPSKIGEFYGLYGMVGRFSAITGPLLWGLVVGTIFQDNPQIGQPIGMLMLLVLVLISMFIIAPVSDAHRDWGVEAETPRMD